MIFVKFGDKERVGIEVASRRNRPRVEKSSGGRRILRDRAMLFLHRAGFSYADIIEIAASFFEEPVRDKSHVRDRIADADRNAKEEIKVIRLRNNSRSLADPNIRD